MSTLTNADLFLVQSNGQLQKITSDQMSNLNDTDLLLVEREGVQYKLEAKDLGLLSGELETPVEVLTPLNGAGIGDLTPYTPISQPIVTVGGGGSVEFETSAITNVEEEVEQSNWNQSQTWSNQFTTTGSISGSLTAIVNGIITFDSGGGPSYSGAAGNPPATITWNVPAGLTGSVKVFGTPANYQYGFGATISASNGFSALDNTGDWVYVGEAENLSSVTVSGNGLDFGPAWQGIEVGGQMLVDPEFTDTTPTGDKILTFTDSTYFDKFQVGDEVIPEVPAQTWTGATVPFSGYGSGDPAILFDGSTAPYVETDLAQPDYLGAGGDPSASFSITFNPPITSETGNIYVYCVVQPNAGGISVNNGPALSVTRDSNWRYVDTGVTSITSLGFGNRASSVAVVSGVQFFSTTNDSAGRLTPSTNLTPAVSIVDINDIDNKMTVDGEGKEVGDTLSKTSTFDASLTCSDSTELANMVGPILMTDENGDLITPQTSEIESIVTIPAVGMFSFGNTYDPDNNQPIVSERVDNKNDPSLSRLIDVSTIGPGGSITLTWVSGWEFYINGGDTPELTNSDTVVHSTTATYTIDDSFPYKYARIYAGGGGETGGQIVYDIAINNGSSVDLTFADSTDLEYFLPGDYLGVSGATDVICGGKACQTEINIGAQGGIAITTSSSSITRIVVDCEGTADNNTSKLTLSSTLLTSNLENNTDCTIVQASNSTANVALLTNGQRETLIFSFAGTTGTWFLSGKRLKIYNVYTDQEGGENVSEDVYVLSTDPNNNMMTVSGGDWTALNQDHVWSSYVSVDGGFMADNPVSNAFDGDTSTSAVTAGTQKEITIDLSSLGLSGTVSVYVDGIGVYGGNLEVNGSNQQAWPAASSLVEFGDVGGIDTIKMTAVSAVPIGFSAIYINGKLLVDAVNDSQVWSSLVTAPGITFNDASLPTLAYNGDLTIESSNRFTIVSSQPYGITQPVTFELPGLEAGKTVEFLGKQSPGAGAVTFNGDTVTGIFESSIVAAEWNTLGTSIAGTNTIVVDASAANTDFYAIRVGGSLLVDTVNDSQVWSENSTGDTFDNLPVSIAFDGNVATQIQSGESGNPCVITLNVSGSKFEIYASCGNDGSYDQPDILINGSTIGNVGDPFIAEWVDVTSFTSGTLDTITINLKSNALYANLGAVRVDGKILVDQSGNSFVSLPTLEASATDVVNVDGNTIHVSGVAGEWRSGPRIKGSQISGSSPSPTSIVFTSANGGTTAVTGVDATLASRTWTLESGLSSTGPWTLVGTYEDLDASFSQDGATPWTTNKPILQENTYYQVKVRYNSLNAPSVESLYNTFKTGNL